MKAACDFNQKLCDKGLFNKASRICCNLYGSLALTGKGHKTDYAVILGLSGQLPETVDPNLVPKIIEHSRNKKTLNLAGKKEIHFDEPLDLSFKKEITLKLHPNGMTLSAYNDTGALLFEQTYFSVGGGFILTEEEAKNPEISTQVSPIPYPFRTAQDLLDLANTNNLSLFELVIGNEQALSGHSISQIKSNMLEIWQVMSNSIERGCKTMGTLEGGLNIKRRASELYQALIKPSDALKNDPLAALDWVNVFAMAVNEENADGGRIVTAPTNGAAGVIPAVLSYYKTFFSSCDDNQIFKFLATAACIGMLYKKNASISAAEVGCQGEIGVACSMAAAGLTAVLDGSNQQIQNAAEIGMEHNLGLTCDPINGLVQIPCIERNTMGAVKAINASRLALRGRDKQYVSLDKVIAAMYQTGIDMQSKYKETSLGGLAVNLVSC